MMNLKKINEKTIYMEYKSEEDAESTMNKKYLIFLDMSGSMRKMKGLYNELINYMSSRENVEIYGFKNGKLGQEYEKFEGLSNMDGVMAKLENLDRESIQYWIVIFSDGEFNSGNILNMTNFRQLNQCLAFKFIGIGLKIYQPIVSEFDVYYCLKDLKFEPVRKFLDEQMTEFLKVRYVRFNFSFSIVDDNIIIPAASTNNWLFPAVKSIIYPHYQNQISTNFVFDYGQIIVTYWDLYLKLSIQKIYTFIYSSLITTDDILTSQYLASQLHTYIVQYFRIYTYWLPNSSPQQTNILCLISQLFPETHHQFLSHLSTYTSF